MKGMLLASLSLLASLVWTSALLIDPGPYDTGAVFLIGLGMIVTAAVSLIGLILVGGRWARRVAASALGGTLILAVVRPIDAIWVIGVIVSALALISLSHRSVAASVRKLPAATGPPERAVLLTLGLLATPYVLGMMSWSGSTLATAVVGASAPLVAIWYSRVFPGGFYVARYGWPAMALGLAFAQPIIPGLTSAVLALAIAAIALDPSVRSAFYPPRERGTALPIPPELTPGDILEAADLDERGRRK